MNFSSALLIIPLLTVSLFSAPFSWHASTADRYKSDGFLHAVSEGLGPANVTITLPARTGYPSLTGSAPFKIKFYFSYYITLFPSPSSLPAARFNRSARSGGLAFATLKLNQPSGPFSFDETILADFLCHDQDTLFLGAILRSGGDSTRYRTLRIPVRTGERIRVEKQVRFFSDDSLEAVCSYDGRQAGTLRVKSFLSGEFCALVLSSFPDRSPVTARLEGFSIDTAPSPAPAPPQGCTELVENGKVTLSFIPGHEKIAQTHWRLFRHSSGETPYLEELTDEANAPERFTIRFTLDSGEYSWQARVRNSQGIFGPFSERKPFFIRSPKPGAIEIKDAYLTEINGRTPVNQINAGTEYDLHVDFAPAASWRDLGYLIVSLNHPDYPYGHPGNKGGRFHSSSNYVFNIAFYPKETLSIQVFEKSRENSFSSILIPDSGQGLYAMPGERSSLLDTIKSHFKLKMRLLQEAKPGRWRLSAYCVSNPKNSGIMKDEVFSSIFHSTLTVLPERPFPSGWIALFSIPILLFTCTFIFLRRKPAVHDVASIKTNILTDYIIKNLHREEISRETVMDELRLSRTSFYELLLETGRSSLPALLNEFRLLKAKETLIETPLTINEISYSVGFKDPGYFIKVFKKSTGRTPAEFREVNRKKS